MRSPVSNRVFAVVAFAIALAIAAASQLIPNEFFFSAAYTVLLYVILATAWNILGGYTGYVNFGSAAFFAIGAYTTVALYYAFKLPLLVTIPAGTAVAGLAGLGLAESFTATFFGPSWAPAVSFGLLLLALAFRPAGLFGR